MDHANLRTTIKKLKTDLTGQAFKRLTVTGFAGIDNQRISHWKCECVCGKTVIVRRNNLILGLTQSCGCLHIERTKKSNRKGYGEASLNVVFRNYQSSASKRNLEFTLNKEVFKELAIQNCNYCGSSPSNTSNRGGLAYGEFIYNGIDRVDNNKGYTTENCVPCCTICNHAKSTLTFEDFQLWINRLVAYQNNKRGVLC